MRIVFMGTPEYAVPVLSAAYEDGHEIVGVYTQPDKPVGRKQILTPSAVKVYATEKGLPIYQPRRVKRKENVEELRSLQPDLILVAAYGQIVSQEILDIPRFGCINLHASLLPKYRGASPIQHSIIKGEAETGVTAMQMDAGIDTGDMIAKIHVAIEEEDTAESLYEKLMQAAGTLTHEILQKLAAGEALPHEKQNDAEATHAPMLKKEDGAIDWSRSAKDIYNQVRGLYPWPGTYTFWGEKKLSVWKAEKTEMATEDAKPGFVKTTKKALYVACGDTFLKLCEVQLQGKKRMDAQAFLLGAHPDGEVFGE